MTMKASLTTKILIVCLLCVAFAAPLWAQNNSDRGSTEQRLEELRDLIAKDEQRLSELSEAEEASVESLRDLDRQIAIRKEISTSYRDRLTELGLQSDSLEMSTAELEQDVATLKEQYGGRAIHAYKYGRLHDLALILSASSINQMLIRVRYLSRFTDQRRDRFAEIQAAAQGIEERRSQLEDAQLQTTVLLQEAEGERQNLLRLQRSRQNMVQQLRAQSTEVEQDLERNRASESAMMTQLKELIAAETARRRERTATNPKAQTEFLALSGSFEQNRGKLPWPATGAIVEPYGDIVNPVHGTRTPNPGILIATTPQAEVRAVFDGTVLGVDVMPEFGTYVAIEHGSYQSVYSNFSMIYVQEGMTVKAGDMIGRAGTDAEPKQAGIFFGLFKNGAPFDPMQWLVRR